MDKKSYEGFKVLKAKVENGKATFKERNVYNIIQKKIRKGEKYYFNPA